MKALNLIQILLISIALLFNGCKQDDIFVTFDNSDDNRSLAIAGPFAKFNFFMKDFLDEIDDEDFMIKVAEDGLLSINFKEEISFEWDDFVVLDDINETWYYSYLKSGTVLKSNTIEKIERLKFNHKSDVRYDMIELYSGILNMILDVNPGLSGYVNITFPEIYENDKELTFNFNVDSYNRHFVLSNHSLANSEIIFKQDPDNISGEEFSYITVVTTINLEADGSWPAPQGPNLSPVDDDVTLFLSLSNMEHEIAYGYFGVQKSEESNLSVSMEIFEELEKGTGKIEIGGFSLDLEGMNAYGVPLSVQIKDLRFYEEADADPDFPDWLLFDKNQQQMDVVLNIGPAEYGPSLIPTPFSLGDRAINHENTNIVDILNEFPNKMLADFIATSNYYNDPEHSNYDPNNPKQNVVSRMSELKTDVAVEVPVWFRAEAYLRSDTVDFDFNDMIGDDEEDVRKIKDLALYLSFSNSIPFELNITATVIDGEGNYISDLLKDQYFIKAGNLVDGKVMEPEQTEFVVRISEDQISDFIDKNAMELVLETKISTANEGKELVKVFDDTGLTGVLSFEIEGQIP